MLQLLMSLPIAILLLFHQQFETSFVNQLIQLDIYFEQVKKHFQLLNKHQKLMKKKTGHQKYTFLKVQFD